MTRDVDLHIHTNASDGDYSFNDIVEKAKLQNLKAISITDHGTLNSKINRRQENVDGLEIISGIEINTDFDGIKIEILGYFIDPNDDQLLGLIDKIKERRRKRIIRIVERVNEMIDESIDVEKILNMSDSSLGRPHVAKELVKRGIVSDIDGAFDNYIGEDCYGYVSLDKVKWKNVIDTIHSAGGLAVLAHPLLFNFTDFFKDLKKMTEYGLDGIEIFYPYDKTSKVVKIHPFNFVSRLKDMDLLFTGGSDFHGSYGDELGKPEISYEHLEKMKDKIEKKYDYSVR